MLDWKKIYEHTLKNICEADVNDFDVLIDQELPKFSANLIKNNNADPNALFSFKLDSNASEEDYKKFCEYIYTYIGEDIYYFINLNFDREADYEL